MIGVALTTKFLLLLRLLLMPQWIMVIWVQDIIRQESLG
jgi:hypothetical protein